MSVFSENPLLKLFAAALVSCGIILRIDAQQASGEQSQSAIEKFKKAADAKKQQGGNFADKRLHGGDGGQPFKELFASLSEEEKAEMKKLQQENPEAFREKLKQKFQNLKQKKTEETSKIKELSKKYNEASAPDEKEKAFKELRALSEKQFDERMENNRKSLENVEKRLSELKKKYEERKVKRNEIIENRVKDLTKDPSLEW